MPTPIIKQKQMSRFIHVNVSKNKQAIFLSALFLILKKFHFIGKGTIGKQAKQGTEKK